MADEQPNVNGRWTGQTRCPLGLAVFTIDIRDGSGTVSHGGYGPERSHPLNYPIQPAFVKGWEGSWVYFKAVDKNYQGSFAGLNGLLSADGQTIDVRSQTALGDCKPFALSRESIAVSKPSIAQAPIGHVDRREPTEAEMRQAVEQSITRSINSPINGMNIYVVEFRKLACEKAVQKPGYICDYYVHTDQQFHSNEGTSAGQQHADAVQTMFDWVIKNTNANKTEVQGRFLYVAPERRWVVLEL
ncbi:MAG TPA: hypothetical protein VGC62_25720 [Pseudomonas sp.]|uniref:hypothetical protein n=1 Tax=Pseudomonas sp. TaxID=306 RepID=UPI002ED834E0